MYRILKGYGRLRRNLGTVRTLTEQELQLPLNTLEQRYTEVYWVIDVPDLNIEARMLTLQAIPIQYLTTLTKTIYDYLEDRRKEDITLESIPWEKGLPHYQRGEVYFWDADSRDFHYQLFSLEHHPDLPIPDEDKNEILVTREEIDYRQQGNYLLFTINGFIHRHSNERIGFIIKDGNKIRNRNPNDFHIGILDFSQIGKVEQVTITPEMIRPANSASSLADNLYIDVSKGYKGSLEGKTIGIVIGGYFHLLDHIYKRVSDTVIKIDFNHMSWETLYYRMKTQLDLSHIGLTDYGNDRVLGLEMYHDSTIIKLFTLSQSFIVVIDNPYLEVEEIPVGMTGLPHRYESAIKPIYPLRVGEGRYLPYKAIKEYDRWSIAVQNNIVPLQVRYQREQDTVHLIHDRIYPLEGEVYAMAHYIRILSDKIVTRNEDEETSQQCNLIQENINDKYYHIPISKYHEV